MRFRRAICADCERGVRKGKGKEIVGGNEEALMGDGEGAAGPSEQVAQVPYKDQEEGGETL